MKERRSDRAGVEWEKVELKRCWRHFGWIVFVLLFALLKTGRNVHRNRHFLAAKETRDSLNFKFASPLSRFRGYHDIDFTIVQMSWMSATDMFSRLVKGWPVWRARSVQKIANPIAREDDSF